MAFHVRGGSVEAVSAIGRHVLVVARDLVADPGLGLEPAGEVIIAAGFGIIDDLPVGGGEDVAGRVICRAGVGIDRVGSVFVGVAATGAGRRGAGSGVEGRVVDPGTSRRRIRSCLDRSASGAAAATTGDIRLVCTNAFWDRYNARSTLSGATRGLVGC